MKIASKSSDSGKVVYTSDIIAPIVKYSLDKIDGVELSTAKKGSVNSRRNQGIRVESVSDLIYIDVYVKVRFSESVRDVAYKVQQIIKNELETATNFKVKDVNVHVVDVEFV